MPRITAALASAFVLLTVLVQAGVTAGLDRRLEPHVAPLAQSDWPWVAVFADPVVTSALFAGGFVLLWRRGFRAAAAAWVVALIAGLAIEVVLKATLGQIAFAPEERVFDLISLSRSYPSGHAMRAVLLAGLATALWPRYVWAWIGYAAFVAVWVVVCGMHLVSDAVGGVLLGATLVAAVDCRWVVSNPWKS